MLNEIDSLYEDQRQSWPRLARGVEGLANAKTRRMRIDWFDVFVRHIPHRVGSTTAAVDRDSVAKRPCFLCSGNLDPEERGIPFNEDYTIYCNPFPIIDHHLTVVYASMKVSTSPARSAQCSILRQRYLDTSLSITVPNAALLRRIICIS